MTEVSTADLVLPRLVTRWPDATSVEFMELANSIRARGILSPLIARRLGSRFQVVDGVWRLAVARELGIESVPCTVVDVDASDALLLTARLNDHRPAIEFAPNLRSYLRRNPELTLAGLSQKLHKAPDWVAECLTLHYLPGELLEMVERGEMPLMSGYFLSKLDRRREMFVDLARTMPAVTFKPVVTEAIRGSRNDRRERITQRTNPETFKPRTWLRSLNTVRAENDSPENGSRQATGSALDGWQAAIRWVLNADPAGIEKQKVNFERKRR